MTETEARQRRVLLLLTNHTYRAPAFLAAAEQLDIEVVQVLDYGDVGTTLLLQL